MVSPQKADIQGELELIIDLHYGVGASDHRGLSSPQFLPGLGLNLDDPVEYITDCLWQASTGLISATRALARISTYLSRYLHLDLCPSKASRGHDRACSRDVDAVTNLIGLISRPFLNLELDAPLKSVAGDALTASGMDEMQIEDALEALFQRITHPGWGSRELLPITPEQPIIQINSAISDVTPDEYFRLRGVSLAIGNYFVARGYRTEITSDYAAPRASPTCAPDEFLTRAAIFRASGIVTIADHGRLGTATTLTIAEDLLIPALVLYQDPVDIGSARYPGGFSRRMERGYGTHRDAIAAAEDYLDTMGDYVANRNAKLNTWRAEDISEIRNRFLNTDVALFDASPVIYQRARFFTSDPILWTQCPPATRTEILRVLGLAGPATPQPERRLAAEASTGSVMALFVAAEHRGWTWDRVTAVYQAYIGLNEHPVSPRKSAWGFDDWIRFEVSLP